MTTPEVFDVIIVGGGPVGLASAYQCGLKEGKKVLLLECFNEFGNIHGSSPGYSRQFRVSYSERNLCELALKTYDMWKTLMEEQDNYNLLQETGCLWFGDPDVESGEGNIDEAIQNLIDLGQPENEYTILNGKEEIKKDKRFLFVSKCVENIPEPKALFTAKGGTINVPAVVQCYENALSNIPNATLIKNARVKKIDHSKQEYVEVIADVSKNDCTTEKSYHGKKIILTAGTYVNEVLKTLSPEFSYRINLIIYLWSSTYFGYQVHQEMGSISDSSLPSVWPVWYFFGPKPFDDSSHNPINYNDYYGFPSEPERPTYVRVAPAFTSEEMFDFIDFPPQINHRPIDEKALEFTSDFVKTSMPDLNPALIIQENSTCVAGFVQLTNEEETDKGAGFLLDFLQPGSKRIVVFTGGWAMKFVPMFGKILSDLAIHGETENQELIEPMNIRRGVLKKIDI